MYFAILSLLHGAPVLIWPVQRPTTRSAMKQSSVSPDRWETMVPQPKYTRRERTRTMKIFYETFSNMRLLTIGLGQVVCSDGFCDGSNLVDFEKKAVACFLVHGSLDTLGVGHCQVITNNLKRQYVHSLPMSSTIRRITWMSVSPVSLDHAAQSSWSKASSIETTRKWWLNNFSYLLFLLRWCLTFYYRQK